MEASKFYERAMSSALSNSESVRADAMAVNAYLKSGKFKRFLEPISKMQENHSNVTAYPALGTGSVYIFINVTNMEGFTGNEVEGLVNLFLYMNPSDTVVTDYPANLSKEFKFVFRGVYEAEYNGRIRSVDVRVHITATAKEDSETCKKVVVGYTEKVEPQPIYKLECSEPAVGEING